ncbi:MAG: 5'-methylthioadenosine/adenosylhomocysteine nucleosidase [Pseudomonadota bacterium]
MSQTDPDTRSGPTAILSAIAQEQLGLIEQLGDAHKTSHAGRDFWLGHLHGQPVVLALSKIGKVAAATTATALIERFGVRRILFTGVAGGLKPGVNVGDVVVASDFVQHDLDASPLFPRYEVPLYRLTRFAADAALAELLLKATALAVQNGFASARIHQGLIASGDRFVSGAAESELLRSTLLAAGHEVLAVEMEGAAVAQVCHDYDLPFAAVRTISDRADDSAHIDFPVFVEQVASPYAREIIGNFLRLL